MTPLTMLTVNLTVFTVNVLILTLWRSGRGRIGNIRDSFKMHVGRAREVKLLHVKSMERPIKILNLLQKRLLIAVATSKQHIQASAGGRHDTLSHDTCHVTRSHDTLMWFTRPCVYTDSSQALHNKRVYSNGRICAAARKSESFIPCCSKSVNRPSINPQYSVTLFGLCCVTCIVTTLTDN